MSAEEIDVLIRNRIEGLRKRLLDLTRRNPLISTRMSARSNSLIRVVDELPEVIRYKLSHGEEMRFEPLPPLEDDPKDEQVDAFQEALASARLQDEVYRTALESVDPDRDDSEDIVRRIERELKDRVRAELGMPLRQQKADLSLQEHARNNGISPQWELPLPEDRHEDGRHNDDSIQTLMLPNDFERRFEALLAKGRIWEQETGINVLHAAFGFLEWKEEGRSSSIYSPLVLMPVKVYKNKKRPAGFRVLRRDYDAETNFTLAENFRLEFGISVPTYTDGQIEDYFRQVSDAAPKTMPWKVRRQVAFGVFPSARMAMYRDLDTTKRSFESNQIISTLFGGSEAVGVTPFADVYHVDDPEIEVNVPYLVDDADSSQFSTIVDVMKGKNLAVEGPPGTGKSQTIVNTIANALGQQKKVLFVAEKMAALEVVKSRLEAAGLGEFVLPLQADRSSREQVIRSIQKRIEMEPTSSPGDYGDRIDRFHATRSELATYINVVAAPFGKTGMTVHDVLGKNIATSERLDGMPSELQAPRVSGLEDVNSVELEDILQKASRFVETSESASEVEQDWAGLALHVHDRFTVDGLVGVVEEASTKFAKAAASRIELSAFGLDADCGVERLRSLQEVLDKSAYYSDRVDFGLVADIVNSDWTDGFIAFLEVCDLYRRETVALEQVVTKHGILQGGAPLVQLSELCKSHSIQSLDPTVWEAQTKEFEESVISQREWFERFKHFTEYFPAARNVPLSMLTKAGSIVQSTDKNVLLARSEETANPNVKVILHKRCHTGEDLLERQKRLMTRITTETSMDVEELRTYAEILESTGFIGRIFSSTFQSAEQAFLRLFKGDSFERSQAVQLLRELARWKEDVHEFEQDHQAKKLFGIHFNGINTDFQLFRSLASYYMRVDSELIGPVNGEIRALLKSGDKDLIEAIPVMRVGNPTVTLQDLETTEIDRSTRRLEAWKSVIGDAAKLVNMLKRPGDVAPGDLVVLAHRIDDNNQRHDKLEQNETARRILGLRYGGATTVSTDFDAEISALGLLKRSGAEEVIVKHLYETDAVVAARAAISDTLVLDSLAQDALKSVAARAGDAFVDRLKNLPPSEVAERLMNAARDRNGIVVHAHLAAARNDIQDVGYGWVIEVLEKHNLPISNFAELLEAVIFRAKARHLFHRHGEILRKFSGKKLDEHRAEFARLDEEIIRLNRQYLQAKVKSEAMPPHGNGRGRRSTFTDLALLNNEIAKKTRFLPVRELTRRAGAALLELKPCWMMSPLAVAQYLPPQTSFDLCIIDEASQMPPEDAVGALYRSTQVMVTGDTNQLPPTNFFKNMLEDEDADEDEVVDEESILELANAVFRPARRLRWHYRSKHSGLIQFSNHHVYEDSLAVFPAPNESQPLRGVSLVPVDGNYRAGVNLNEARKMIGSVLAFVRKTPDRSLGVVTLNQKQRDLLLEEWDRELNRDAAAARYVEDWLERNDGLEPFFIKNLENVQGDERDVIYIGTVYGPEQPGGRLMQRFGPVTGRAGWRRLNVLFSRAKEQIVTFSSMTAADIRADENVKSGAFLLKRWLEYAATGQMEADDYSGHEPDSDFERHVIYQLASMGCTPVPQVGVAGFRIDIGVQHADWPHGFIMGVECDGATYHSSRSARDRDRLREKVLTRLGWHLHRIWSTDWFNDPPREAEKLRAAIEARLEVLKKNASVASETMAVLQPLDTERPLAEEGSAPPTDIHDFPRKPIDVAPEPSRPVSVSTDVAIVEVGDLVRVKYLDGDDSSRDVIISDTVNNPGQGIVHASGPLGRAVLGAELEEEIEVLIGNTVRPAIIESIRKGVGFDRLAVKDESEPDRVAATDVRRTENVVPLTQPRSGAEKTADPAVSSNLEKIRAGTNQLRPDEFYESEYLGTLRNLACNIVDDAGPVTFRHLSEIVARKHGFQRTGSRIKKRVWAAVSRERAYSSSPDGEEIFWAMESHPLPSIGFRGMTVAGVDREWQHIPHPERLGLALEVLRKRPDADIAGAMAQRLGIARLHQKTRQELEEIIAEARKISAQSA